VIENQCTDRVYIEPGLFRLYLSSQPSVENAETYRPTTRGSEYQTNRLVSDWLEQLIFEVKLTQDEEAGKARQYRILRYHNALPCPIEYMPY
jgi:hypothetical protein